MHAVEAALRDQGALPMRFGPSTTRPVDSMRVDENLRMIHAELDAPAQSWLARALTRLGVSDTAVPLVTATPALRRVVVPCGAGRGALCPERRVE